METFKSFPLRCELEVSWLSRALDKLYRNLKLIAKLGMAVSDRPFLLEPSSNDLEVRIESCFCVIHSLVRSIETRVKSLLRFWNLHIRTRNSFPYDNTLEGFESLKIA